MELKRYPCQLPRGANNAAIALSATEVGKLFSTDTRSDIGSEAEKTRFANEINTLVVKFKRLETNEALASDMLVMERIYPLDFRAYEVKCAKFGSAYLPMNYTSSTPLASCTATCSGHPTCLVSGLTMCCLPRKVCG